MSLLMRLLRWLGLLFALSASLAPFAHVLELPNKLRLDGELWLGIQQHLYQGWGPLIGAPSEVGGLLVSLVLVAINLRKAPLLLLYGIMALSYVAMMLCFFLLSDPVNKALSRWTLTTLPSDWPAYRLEWETGHALAAFFGLLAVIMAISGILICKESTKRGE